MPNRVVKIVSGGQTGADRAALDFAIENGIEHGGFVPAGRMAEDGDIPARYTNLIETGSADPDERTRSNVLAADATLLITHGNSVGGSKLTEALAHELTKPLLHIDLFVTNFADAVRTTRKWLDITGPSILNIAGPRASEDEQIYDAVKSFLTAVFQK